VEYTSVHDHFKGLVPGKGDFDLKSWRFLGCEDNDHLFHGLAHYTKVDGRIKETSHLYHWLLLERGSKKYNDLLKLKGGGRPLHNYGGVTEDNTYPLGCNVVTGLRDPPTEALEGRTKTRFGPTVNKAQHGMHALALQTVPGKTIKVSTLVPHDLCYHLVHSLGLNGRGADKVKDYGTTMISADADSDPVLEICLDEKLKYVGFFQFHGRAGPGAAAEEDEEKVAQARARLQPELTKRLESRRVRRELTELGLVGTVEGPPKLYTAVNPDVLQKVQAGLHGIRLVPNWDWVKGNAAVDAWKHGNKFLDRVPEVEEIIYPPGAQHCFIGPSSLLDENGNSMQGLFASHEIRKGALIDLYYGIVAAHCGTIEQLEIGQYPNKTPFPNLERALKLSKYDCIMKDCTGTALKLHLVGTKTCRATYANEVRDDMKWDEGSVEYKALRDKNLLGNKEEMQNAKLRVVDGLDEVTVQSASILLERLNDRKYMVQLRATKKIEVGREIFTNYNVDAEDDGVVEDEEEEEEEAVDSSSDYSVEG